MSLWKHLRTMDFRQLWTLSCLSLRHLRFVIPTLRATRKTIAICEQHFPEHHHGHGPENAFRHALWNALIVQRSLQRKLPLDRSLAWAKTITDWHEKFSPNPPLPEAMDFHNNAIGRQYMRLHPRASEAEIIAFFLADLAQARKFEQIEAIEGIDTMVYLEDPGERLAPENLT